MRNSYYVDNAGEVQGPVSPQELETLHRSGQVSATTQVCEEGTENWMPYYQAAGTDTSNPSKTKTKKEPESKPSKKEQEAAQPSARNTEFGGITKGQGTVLIILLLIGIGAPFWVFLKPTPNWEYQTVEILAETSGTASILGENYEKLAYKTIPEFSTKLDSMGSQGWELVSSFLEHETAHPNFGNEDYVSGLQPNTRPQKLVLIFKRPKKL